RGLARLQLEAEERDHAVRQAASLRRRAALEAHIRAAALLGYLDASSAAEQGWKREGAAASAALRDLRGAAAPAGLLDLVPGEVELPLSEDQLPEADDLAVLEERTAKELSAAENALADSERAAVLAELAGREQARETQLRGEAGEAEDAASGFRKEQEALRAALPDLRGAAAAMEPARRRMEDAAKT
ncbi:MAG: hypothetical protein ABTA24_16690, partial [Arthrobacter sp.]